MDGDAEVVRAGALDARAANQDALARALAGRYRVEELIGRGGMADVYRAHDLKHDRPVAIKLLHGRPGEPIDAGRFAREIRIAASLAHPNIVPLIDSGTFESLHYYVMPFVPEGTLGHRLASEGPLPVATALRLAIELADALDCAHRHGLVHRDVKPENVLFLEGHAMLADFGIARVPPRAGDPLTPTSARLGTPLYMSPEQSVGAGDVDARSDQYSLACVLYEMLAGIPPFPNGRFELLAYQHRAVEPVPVTERRPDVPAAAGLALRRALSKLPADRFATAHDFARALEAGLLAPAGHSPGRAGPAPLAAAANVRLPRAPTSFVGREHELWTCARLLEGARLVTLSGPGGCGKTRLAIELAARVAPHHPDGVWFADLSALGRDANPATAVARAADVREQPDRPLIETLTRALADRRGLLILDNAEHVREAAARLAATLLEAGASLRLLVTSREPLGLYGEQIYVVPPMSLPAEGAPLDGPAAERSEALRLFVERGRSARPDLEWTEAALRDAAALCRRLDGSPLAIELAAARLRLLSIGEIRSRLSERFRLLTGGPESAPERHRTLRAAIQWSEEQLSPAERDLFVSLAVFSGGWTLAAAANVCGAEADEIAMLDGMTRLADRSLLDAEPGEESRYRYHESLRAYAAEHLEVDARRDALRDAHLAYFLALAESADAAFWGPEQARWLARIDREQDNVLAAFERADARSDGGLAGLRLAAAMYRSWYTHGHYALGRRLLARALAHAGAGEPTPERARALFAAAGLAMLQGDLDEARRHDEEALRIYRLLGDRAGEARTLVGLGALAAREGRLDEASAHYAQSLALYRGLGDRRSVSMLLHNRGSIAMRRDDLDEARASLAESLELSRGAGNTSVSMASLVLLAAVSTRRGEHERARIELLEALDIAGSLHAPPSAAEALETATELAIARGEIERSARWLAAAQAFRAREGMARDTHQAARQTTQVAHLRARLPEAAFLAAWRSGERLGPEDALREARDWLQENRS